MDVNKHKPKDRGIALCAAAVTQEFRPSPFFTKNGHTHKSPTKAGALFLVKAYSPLREKRICGSTIVFSFSTGKLFGRSIDRSVDRTHTRLQWRCAVAPPSSSSTKSSSSLPTPCSFGSSMHACLPLQKDPPPPYCSLVCVALALPLLHEKNKNKIAPTTKKSTAKVNRTALTIIVIANHQPTTIRRRVLGYLVKRIFL